MRRVSSFQRNEFRSAAAAGEIVIDGQSLAAAGEADAADFGEDVLGLPREAWDPNLPVDFYLDDLEVTTYADCELTHDYGIYTAPARDEGARGGDVDLTITLDGFTDSGPVSGQLWFQASGYTSRRTFGPVEPDEDSEGNWSFTIQADPASSWAISVAEISGAVVGWGTTTGDALAPPLTEATVALTADGLVESAWDGAPDPRIEAIAIWQNALLLDDGFTWLQLPLVDGAPPDQQRPLQMVAGGDSAPLSVVLRRNDLPECDYNRQSFDVPHSPTATLQIPDLFDVLYGVNPYGEELSFRPTLGWANVPDDPDGSIYVSLYVWGQDGESMSWTILPRAGCELDRATWPSQLPPAPPYAWAWVSAWYFTEDRSTSCSWSTEFPGL